MNSNLFELSVEVEGHRVKEFGHQSKTYIEGRKGKPFVLKFKNNSADRVHAVFAVDGLSVIDGNPATPGSSGYIVQGYSALEVKGWRTSLDETHKFVFEKKSGSYAGKKASVANCGVIGCLVYAEKQKVVEKVIDHWHSYPVPQPYPVWPRPYYQQPYYWDVPMYSATSAISGNVSCTVMLSNSNLAMDAGATKSVNCCSAASPDYNLGTAFGESQVDQVSTVQFENGPLLATLENYYTDRQGLAKVGIKVDKTPQLVAGPQAFSQFCTPPPK